MSSARWQVGNCYAAWLISCGLISVTIGCGRSPESEADTVKQLKTLGVLAVKDNNSGFVKVVNLSGLDDESKTSEAVKLTAQLVQPTSATFNNLTLSPEDLSAIGSMKTLNELNLTGTNVDDAGVEKLGGLKRLGTLYLVGTKITDKSLDTIAGFKELKVLGLGRTGLTGSLASLSGLKKLNWVEISEMKLSDELLKSLGQLPALQVITMLDSEHNPKVVEELKTAKGHIRFDIVRGSLEVESDQSPGDATTEQGGEGSEGGAAEEGGKGTADDAAADEVAPSGK